MVSFLALLPRALTTFLYAVAALLRFYADTDTTPIQLFPLTILQWSFLAFALGTAALLANLGLEWHAGNQSRYREIEKRDRAAQERERAARRARIQNRGFILQTRYQLTPGRETGAALTDFLSFLQEYGE
ncbi:hypothetical protein [Picosynechococcus sp. PCC 7117]|uniref:hypothetical protein n=1 Tax=Picosynechococcus sp. PCC 7117 TaxID=195498 RepID=UPI000810A75A|nr:hypothetical protein [Picosynechococcus sp. PCC 7117]ANV87370.1 hypothetical protein AWQ22_07820 [Picosynechococcus sp. PCC 7117]